MQVEFLQVKASENGPNIKLELCHGTYCGGAPGQYPDIALNPGTGSHVFVVTIADPTLGVKFDDDALWIQSTHGSPTQKKFDSAGQIANFTKANDTTIFFTDANNNDPKNGWLTMGYRLNFKDSNGKSLSIDPDIKNGGGTTAALTTLQVAELALGLATLVTILFVAFRLNAVKRMVADIAAWTRSK